MLWIMSGTFKFKRNPLGPLMSYFALWVKKQIFAFFSIKSPLHVYKPYGAQLYDDKNIQTCRRIHMLIRIKIFLFGIPSQIVI